MKLEILAHIPENHLKTSPLLFVHGGSHAAWCWEKHFLPYFAAQGYPAYALSLRGHGESEGREKLDTYTLADYIDDVMQVMQKISDRPVIVGHSLGGAIVQKIWQEHPEKLKAIVLLASSGPNGMTQEWLKVFLHRFKSIYQLHLFNTGKVTKFPESVRDMFFSTKLPLEKREAYASLLQRESVKAGQEMIRQDIDPKSMDTNIPLLVLGSRKDQFFSEKIAMRIAKAYHVEPTIVDDVCHDMMLDPQWQMIAEIMLRFLQEAVDPTERK